MDYKYEGNAIRNLFEDYKNDKQPYLTAEKKFPEDKKESSKIIRLLKRIFFPNYINAYELTEDITLLEEDINDLGKIFCKGIKVYNNLDDKEASKITNQIIDKFKDIRIMLKMDIDAAFANDPAATDYAQIIRAYPGFHAILIHRVVHELYLKDVKGYAREIQEKTAHSPTGIDIHPGAKIGKHFFIDHGTGVVIGETTEIGNSVRIYQGVTLGVLHFKKDDEGILKKGYKRHPTLGNNIIVGAGAHILGPITIGDCVSIGSGSEIQEDIPPNTTVYKEIPNHIKKERVCKN